MYKDHENIWLNNAQDFIDVLHSSQKNVLHPLLAEFINAEKPQFLLDYGCGDGRILKLVNKEIVIDVYDKYDKMLSFAKVNSGEKIRNFYNNISQIPDNYYDNVLLSMVLVCIDNETEYLEVLSNIKRIKKVKGKVFIAVTHPCFRDRRFSNFSTSYSKKKPFKYLNEGEPFEVRIQDQMPPSVAFTDFHWPLSFTLNKIIQSGMEIIQIIETPDDTSHKNFNPLFSPYLIIISK